MQIKNWWQEPEILASLWISQGPLEKLTLTCLLNAEERSASSEEIIRQLFVSFISWKYGVPLTFMQTEYPIVLGSKRLRADLVFMEKTKKPIAVIEFKAKRSDRALEQLKSYLYATDISYGALFWTEGYQLICRVGDKNHPFLEVENLESWLAGAGIDGSQFQRKILKSAKETLFKELSDELAKTKASFKEQSDELAKTKASFKEQSDELAKTKASFKEQSDELAKTKVSFKEQPDELAKTKASFKEQSGELAKTKAPLEALRFELRNKEQDKKRHVEEQSSIQENTLDNKETKGDVPTDIDRELANIQDEFNLGQKKEIENELINDLKFQIIEKQKRSVVVNILEHNIGLTFCEFESLTSFQRVCRRHGIQLPMSISKRDWAAIVDNLYISYAASGPKDDRENSDPVASFIEERCAITKSRHDVTRISEILENFLEWKNNNGNSKGALIWSSIGLAKRLRRLGHNSFRRADGTFFNIVIREQ